MSLLWSGANPEALHRISPYNTEPVDYRPLTAILLLSPILPLTCAVDPCSCRLTGNMFLWTLPHTLPLWRWFYHAGTCRFPYTVEPHSSCCLSVLAGLRGGCCLEWNHILWVGLFFAKDLCTLNTQQEKSSIPRNYTLGKDVCWC